jgi:galactosamine-6-phosphate isomerase
MKITTLDTYEDMSRAAASLIISELEKNKNLLLCAATGNSPTGTYAILNQEFTRSPELFSGIHILKLDEWGGIPMSDPGTCESYLQSHLIKPLGIDKSRFISFNSDPADPRTECLKIQFELNQRSGIDICILGLGMNGHIALNEPATFLETGIHMAKLSESSLGHTMVSGMKKKPGYGLTLGMADILKSKLIILLINGEKKKRIAAQLLSGRLTTQLPASFLWLHPNVICLMDRAAFSQDEMATDG